MSSNGCLGNECVYTYRQLNRVGKTAILYLLVEVAIGVFVAHAMIIC